jgi:hypothetical protein
MKEENLMYVRNRKMYSLEILRTYEGESINIRNAVASVFLLAVGLVQ